MSQPVVKSIDVFLTLDRAVIEGYFNRHDPAPIYKRQLSHEFEEYILTSCKAAKRHSVLFFKLKCKNEFDRQYAEPVMYAIRRHFAEKRNNREAEFTKFKRRSWTLLGVSIAVVVLIHCLLPFIVGESALHTGLVNSLDIFSWVLLWHPIDELVFHWNPHLKDLCLLEKISTCESIIVFDNERKFSAEPTINTENENSIVVDHSLRLVSKRNYAVGRRDGAAI